MRFMEEVKTHCDCLQPPEPEVPLLRRDDSRGRIEFRKDANKPKNKAKQAAPRDRDTWQHRFLLH